MCSWYKGAFGVEAFQLSLSRGIEARNEDERRDRRAIEREGEEAALVVFPGELSLSAGEKRFTPLCLR